MVNGTAKLVVDLGNSETRVTTYFGKNSKGEDRKKTSILSNRFGELPESKLNLYLDNDVYTEANSRIFKHNNAYYSNGLLCDTEFGSIAIRPSALEKKYNSLVTKLTIINALCRGYEDIAEFTNNDLDSIDVKWELTLLLPPEDIDAGAKDLAEMAKGITEIEFALPKVSRDIEVTGVKIFPEGFAALIAILFESKGVLRKDYTYLVEEDTTTLICDIGAGTTDFVLARGCSIVSSTRFTREVGGNNVHQKVRRLLKEQGIVLSDSAVRKGCEAGFVKSGAKKYSITDEIAKAKSDVSKQLVDAVQEFFEDNMIPINSINNLLVCGGGSEASSVEGIQPISDYISDYMSRLSKHIHLVELPKDEEGNPMSSRMLNIIGAGILSE